MAPQTGPLPSTNDIWASAAAQLSEEDRRNINFSCPDKRKIVESLALITETSKQSCIDKKWRYIRKSGETVILRDVFEKVIKWINVFKEAGDMVAQYDPGHAALPWAGVRFILQFALNDHAKFGFIVEGIASIVESIFRYAAIEALYPLTGSSTAKELERALVHLYAAIMIYLSKAKSYLEENSAKRILKSGFFGEGDFDGYIKAINQAQENVDQRVALVDRHDQVHSHMELRRLLESANAPLRRMDDNLSKIQDNLEASKRTEILRWLSPEPYIQHHEQTKRDILQGTGQWLLSDPVFHQWKTESVSSILWLHGIPGSGKSKLVSIVIEDSVRDFETRQSPPPAFFYCSRNTAEPARSDPEKILASLARQLSNLRPEQPLFQPTVAIYKKKEAEAFASGPLRIEESRDLIIQLAELYPLTIIVIDALDECNPEKRSDLLDALEMILQDSANLIKVFITSRNDADIVFHLRQYPNLEISSERNSEDIANFVKSTTKELIRKKKLLKYSKHKHDMEELIVQRLIKEASGMFRWASLQLQYLCSFSIDDDIRERLGKLPHSLETLYLELYKQISTRPSERENAICRNTLSWLLCAGRTMGTQEFLSAISIVPNKGFVEVSKDQVLDVCNNFVVFDAQMDTFRLAHLSVREFLERHPSYSGISTNSLAAEICLLALVSTTPNSTANSFLSEFGQVLTEKTFFLDDFKKYSNIYWAIHCQLAGSARTQGRLKEIFQFFLSHGDDPTSPFALWMVKSNDFTDFFDYLLSRRLQDCRAGSASVHFVAGCFDFSEILQQSLQRRQVALSKLKNTSNNGILQVCARHGSCKSISLLLEQGEDTIKITEDVLTAAAGNYSSGKEVMSLLLVQRGDEIKITEKVLTVAAGNYSSGKEVMSLLLEQREIEVKITQDVVKAAARNGGQGEEVMSLLLKQRGNEVKITEDVVKAAAENNGQGEEVMSLLLEQRGDEIKITEDVVKVAARNYRKAVMSLLLKQRENKIKITEEVLTAAAGNYSNGKEVMSLLLKQRGNEVKITEDVVKAAARNGGSGKEVMSLLLKQRGDEIKITEDVVKAAAGNGGQGEEVMSLLLKQRGDEVKITEDVVKAAARNGRSGKEVMSLLLKQRGDEIKITEDVVKAAAGNDAQGEEVMSLLLKQRGNKVKIIEDVLTVAAMNYSSGEEVMSLLLEQRGDEVKITENVVKAAARNGGSGKEVMSLLLKQRGNEVKITEDVVKAAAENNGQGEEVMSLLLKQRGNEVKITEDVVKAAARNYRRAVMSLLLEQRGDEIKITEEVVKAAVSNDWRGKEVMSLLLEQRGDEIKITEDVVKAAAENNGQGEEVMSLLLKQRENKIKITEEVLTAAAGNYSNGKEVMSLLLKQRGNEVKITEDVVKAAARNGGSGKEVMSLLLEQRGNEVKITEEVLTAAARNGGQGKEVMSLLLEQRGDEIKITEEVVKAAAGNEKSGGVCLAAATCGQCKVLDLLCRRNGFRPLQGEWISIATFYNAAKSGDVESVKKLLCEGTHPDVKNIRSVTPLWIAAARGHKAVVELLAQREDVDVNSLSNAGKSPIFWPSARGDEVIVSLLMAAGAEPKFVDENGDTAASIARKYGHGKILRILQQPG